MQYNLEDLAQEKEQEIHRDRIASVYRGKASDSETQRRARERIDWTVKQCQGNKVFDIGCSEGITAILLAKNGFQVDAIDINPEVIEHAEKLIRELAPEAIDKVDFRVENIFSLTEIRPNYDTVVIGEVLAHVYEPANMIKRSVLALKLGGRIIITIPWGYLPAPDHHQIFFLTNFLEVVSDVIDCDEVSVVDGHIRFIGTKKRDPLLIIEGEKRPPPPVRPNTLSLFEETEKAAFDSQKFLRDVLERAHTQTNIAKKRERKIIASLQAGQAEKLRLTAKFQREQSKKGKTITKLKRQTSLLPKTMGRIRNLRHLIRIHGYQDSFHIIYSILRQKALNNRITEAVINKIPAVYRKKYLTTIRIVQQPTLDEFILEQILSVANYDFIVICNNFPNNSKNYGGEFVRSRVEAYLKHGLTGAVFVVSPKTKNGAVDKFGDTNTPLFMLPPAQIYSALKCLSEGNSQILVHSPPPIIQKAVQSEFANNRLIYWFHGFEVRDYRRLSFNYTTSEMAVLKIRLDATNKQRIEAGRESFPNPQITKIFVSNYLKTIAERDIGAAAINAHIIPNFINNNVFKFAQKTEKLAHKFLLIRSFDRRNYASDIAIDAINILSSREGFDKLHFTIRGFGENFKPLTSGLRGLNNVTLEETYSTPDEMVALYRDHGVFLCPTRFDTQGVTLGEAMASGLACITNAVTGIPEFIDDSCGILVPEDDPEAFAEAIWRIKENPSLVSTLSTAAGKRAREQCGIESTIAREIELMRDK